MQFLTPRRLLAALVVLLIVAALQPDRRSDALAKPLRAAVEMFATPVRAPLHALGNAVRDQGPRDLALHDLNSPGWTLQRLAQLQDEVDRLRVENRQLRRLRALIGEESPLVPVEAAVTGVTGPSQSPVLHIDRGTTSGITKGRIVVNNFHLVGEIAVADPMTAVVKPVTTARARLFARLMPRDGQALRDGPGLWLHWSAEQQAFVQQVSSAMAAEVGDIAILADDAWLPEARGFFLGQVADIRDDPADPLNFKQMIVLPTYRLPLLRRVTVLTPMPPINPP